MDQHFSQIRTYRFTMSPQGTVQRDGNTYTYSGPCELEVELQADGQIRHIYPPYAHHTVSWTFPFVPIAAPATTTVIISPPMVEPEVPVPVATTETVDEPPMASEFRFPGSPSGPTLLSPTGKRKRSEMDGADILPDLDVPGPFRSRYWWADAYDFDDPRSPFWIPPPESLVDPDDEPTEQPVEMHTEVHSEEQEEEEPMEYSAEEPATEEDAVSSASDCVELVVIESSCEVVDLTSDSDSDYDPSEGTSAPSDFGASW